MPWYHGQPDFAGNNEWRNTVGSSIMTSIVVALGIQNLLSKPRRKYPMLKCSMKTYELFNN